MTKKILFISSWFLSLVASSQYIATEGSFEKTYTRIRGWEKQDSDWVYSDGSMVEWNVIFNVDFLATPDGKEMFGVVLEDAQGQPQYFCNYIGDLIEGEEDGLSFHEYHVDILSKDDDTGKWEFWDSGALRYYGSWMKLYLGIEPYHFHFVYFGVKE